MNEKFTSLILNRNNLKNMERKKDFEWEDYQKGCKEYKFSDLTLEELKVWAYNWEYNIEEREDGIYLIGSRGQHTMKWK